MKILKNNLKLIIGFVIGVILAGGVAYAAVTASEIGYTRTGTSITNVAQALNNLYEARQRTYTGEFYISGYQGGASYTYSRTSYFDIDVSNYNKIKINITEVYNRSEVFTAYVLADGVNVKNITETEEFEINTTSVSNIRIYYYENEGYYYLQGTYTLSN